MVWRQVGQFFAVFVEGGSRGWRAYQVLSVVGALVAAFSTQPGSGAPMSIDPVWALVLIGVYLFIALCRKVWILEREIEPKVRLVFDPNDPMCVATWPKHANEHAKRRYRLKVENDSSAEVAKCSVQMMALDDKDGNPSVHKNIPFKLMNDNPSDILNMPHKESFSLPEKHHEYVDIVAFDETTPDKRFRMLYATQGPRSRLFDLIPFAHSPHTLKIVAVGGGEPVSKEFKIYLRDDG